MRKRLIPVLLLDRHRRLVKTVGFGARTYIGDPFNVVRLFNEKEVDELVILDIDATPDGRAPDLGFLGELASECFMPLAYGGGITSLRQCERLGRAGIEKFILGRGSGRPDLIAQISGDLGAQAVVACVDFIGRWPDVGVVSMSGMQRVGVPLLQHCESLQRSGVGEIILQSVDRDGSRSGYDLETVAAVSRHLQVPVVALGGAGELPHLEAGLAAGASAAASGSAFAFIGRLRAVLITYPEARDLEALPPESAP